MKKSDLLKLIIVVLVLFVTQLACGSSNSGTKVGEAGQATSAPALPSTYKAGDIIKVDDYTITLNSAEVQGTKLIANFTADNTSGTKEISMSSLLSFSAKDSEGNKLSTSFCDGGGFDGSVLVGDKLKGNVCWDGVLAGAKLKIYFESNIFSSGAIVWEVN